MRPLFVSLALSVALALAFVLGLALRPTLFPTVSTENGVVPSVVGLHGRAALRTLATDGFGVLPVPVVPSSRQQFNFAVVYKQVPAGGTKVSRRLITIYAHMSPAARLSAIEKMWRAKLRVGALVDRKRRFPNPPRATFDARLRLAASRYHFTVVKVQILHPQQAAPFVVVETKDELRLASSTAAILNLIDPKARTNDDRTGWAYEGFLFEARSNQGVPFLATFNWKRGPHAGGGQWAADPSLYPFGHG